MSSGEAVPFEPVAVCLAYRADNYRFDRDFF